MEVKKVFVSYGHDRYSFVVERYVDALSNIFEDVFFDGQSLHLGERYDYSIEEAIEHCDTVLFFMTKYSVRTNNNYFPNADDSFCRDEIEYARSFRKSIIPVMLEDCQPPLIVHRLQYIDAKKVIHSDLTYNEKEYEIVRAQILAVIADISKLAQYGKSYSLMQILNQFGSDAYSKCFIRDYIGRKWLSQKCLSWIDDSHEKVMCIIGEIGSGKSSFITNLVFDDREGYFAGIHYCRFDIESSTKVKNIVKSLTYSVATQLSGFSQYIEGISERVLDTASGIELFEKLLIEPLHKIKKQNNTPVVVIIDALDEISDISEKKDLMTILSDSSRYLPDWFKIIVTSRPDNKLEYLLQDTTIITIDTASTENIRDIRDYIENYISKNNLLISDEEKDKLIQESNGNFLYIHFALLDILENGLCNYDNKQYPKGLNGIYARTINRKFKNIEEYEIQIVPIFEVLCATKAPISLKELSKVVKESKRILLSKIQRISIFLRKEENTICLYHKSLAEWLISWEKSEEYYIDNRNGEKKILAWLKDSDNDFVSSNYCMRYGINHLIENKEYSFLNELLQDKQFIIAEIFSTVLLEYVYRNQFDIICSVIYSVCSQPSIISFVVIRRLIDGCINAGQFDRAISINKIQNTIEAYNVFYYTGFGNIVLYRSKDIITTEKIYIEGMKLAKEKCSLECSIWNQFALSVCNSRMGKIMVEFMRMKEALEFYRTFLNLSINLHKETNSIEILRNVAIGHERVGWVFQSFHNYSEALKQYNLCLVESQKIYNETNTVEALRGIAITYERLGRVVEIQGDYEKAVNYYMHNYTMSSEIYNRMGALNSKRGLANSCHCLGDAYIGQHQYSEALKWFQKDKQISSEIYSVTNMLDDIRDYAICLDRLAFTNDKLNRYKEAEILYNNSVNLYIQIVNRTKAKKLVTELIIEYIRQIEFYLIHHNSNKSSYIIDKALNLTKCVKIQKDVQEYLNSLKKIAINGENIEYGNYFNRRNTK